MRILRKGLLAAAVRRAGVRRGAVLVTARSGAVRSAAGRFAVTVMVAVALAAAGVAATATSCSGGGAIVTAMLLDELFGTEHSTIYIDNAFRKLTLTVGEEFPLRIVHRQLRDSGGPGYYDDRYYYEEEVSDDCSYTSSDPEVVGVDDIGILYALAPGTAVISVKFDLLLQKADFASLTVTVIGAD